MSAVQEVQQGASTVAAGATALLAAESLSRQLSRGDQRNWLKIARRTLSLVVALASAYAAYQSLRSSFRSGSQS